MPDSETRYRVNPRNGYGEPMFIEVESFQKVSDNFLNWFRGQDGSTFHPGIKLVDLRLNRAGRGIIATETIPEDTILFTIPRESVITYENSSFEIDNPDFFDKLDEEILNAQKTHKKLDGNEDEDVSMTSIDRVEAEGKEDDEGSDSMGLDPWLKLILTLVYEFIHQETSTWKEYLAVLPESFDTPMFWNEADLNELQGSSLLNRIGRETAEYSFRNKLLPIIRRHTSVFFPDGEDGDHYSDEKLVSLMHRVGSTIMAYAFDLEKDDDDDLDEEGDGWIVTREGTMLGMVPMADMLNADAEFNAYLNHGEDELSMISVRRIEKGEEVLNYYGPLPRSDLLRRYGYVSDKHAVHDIVEVEWKGVLEALKQHLGISEEELRKVRARIDEADWEDTFIFEGESVEPDSSGRLPVRGPNEQTTVGIPEDLHAQLKELLNAIRKELRPSIEKDAIKLHEWHIVIAALQAKLAQYPTTLGEDEKLLKTEGLTGRLVMAIKVRLGEKWISSRGIESLKAKIAERDREAEGVAEGGGKRRRMA